MGETDALLGSTRLGPVFDVGPAGPATATRLGVVLFDEREELWLARWGRGRGAGLGVEPIAERAGPFSLAPSPAVSGQYAYWISRGGLLRQALQGAGSGASAELLARDARVGTRAVVPAGPAALVKRLGEVVAYVARPDDPEAPLAASLWVDAGPGGEPRRIRLSEGPSSANSVGMLAEPNGVRVMTLEARTGMSLAHALTFPWGPGTESFQVRDEVVWIGGPSRPSTELRLFDLGGTPLALIAMERDIVRFGLARLPLVQPSPKRLTPAEWLDYPNGIEPAPFAAAKVCGKPALITVEPEDASAGAAQRLVWRELSADLWTTAEGTTRTLATARRFVSVSLFADQQGALLTYVADRRTWARALRC